MNSSRPWPSARRSPAAAPHELGRAVGDHLQELDQVEVVDQGVGDLDEDLREPIRCNLGHQGLLLW